MTILGASDKVLSVLLYPTCFLEKKMRIKTDTAELPLPTKHIIAAHIERWGLMLVGIYAGLTGLLIIAVPVVIGFSIAMLIDPIVWVKEKLKSNPDAYPFTERNDFKLGLVVNLAPMLMFFQGLAIGLVLVMI